MYSTGIALSLNNGVYREYTSNKENPLDELTMLKDGILLIQGDSYEMGKVISIQCWDNYQERELDSLYF